MRNNFAKSLVKLAKLNKKIVLLSGDIGNKLFDDFKKKFPDRFYNCGVAENNMVGVAAGLAVTGYIPFVYTITPFLISRSFEQIRLDVCYPNLNIFIVGVGGGLSYSRLGPTHHSVEDLSLMQSIPNIKIYTPSSPDELNILLPKILIKKGPCYLRLGKKGEPNFHSVNKIKMPATKITEGKKILILSLGNILQESYELYLKLKSKNVESCLVTVNCIKPFNLSYFKNLIKKFKTIIIVEEHLFHGGLASLIKSNYDLLNLKDKKVLSFNVPDKFLNGLGEQNEARDIIGISGSKICKKVLKIVKN